MSLEGLAEKIGVTWQTVQKYETEPQRLRVHQLAKMAEVLNCSVVDLVTDAPPASEVDLALGAEVSRMSDDEKRRALELIRVAFGRKSANDAAA